MPIHSEDSGAVGAEEARRAAVLRPLGRIVSMAVIVAVAVNTDGRREILGITVMPSEAETF